MLEHIRDATTPGYSKLIVYDLILPDMGASKTQARLDIAMMRTNSGVERSACEFTELLESAGFKGGVWNWPDRDGIVEAEVAL
jgi:hypothetical protein